MFFKEFNNGDQEGQMGIEKFMTEELSVTEESQAATAAKKSDDDDLGLALDALRDCDNEFSKFVQVRRNVLIFFF